MSQKQIKFVEDMAEKVLLSIRESINLIDINQDKNGEFSKERNEIRVNALTSIIKIVETLKEITSSAENLLKKGENIHNVNNQKLISVVMPNILCETVVVRENIGGVNIVAKKVDYLEQVGPELCFMHKINRFAVRFAGILLVGNIGNIYANCSNPERVKECHFANVNYLPLVSDKKTKQPQCSKTNGECLFYHNPLLFHNSTEPRNFFATCGHYVSSDDPNSRNTNFLRYGNRNTLKDDMIRLSDEEKRRFEDYVTHLVFCLILLKRKNEYSI
jgi:hypothetical protein